LVQVGDDLEQLPPDFSGQRLGEVHDREMSLAAGDSGTQRHVPEACGDSGERRQE
jgi:hypothetical protein